MPFDLAPPAPAFTPKDLVAWLERQPPDKTYSYTSHCLLAQFARDNHLDYRLNATWLFGVVTGLTTRGRMERVAVRHPRTFGAALTRARALL